MFFLARPEVDYGALLHHMRRFVRRRMKIGRAGKSNLVANGVGARADISRRRCCLRAMMRAAVPNIMAPERALGLVEMWTRRCLKTAGFDSMDNSTFASVSLQLSKLDVENLPVVESDALCCFERCPPVL